ncbi:MAG TPA: TlpA disulfide reductase family protein [Casimicrobiaceae bacterium]
MSVPKLRALLGNHKWPLYRVGIVALGVLVLAASIVGVWYAQRPPENAPQVDTSPVALAQLALSPRPVANVEFEDGQGRKRTLADFRGKVVLLNIWATWCVPCRTEMPTLDRLQSRLGSENFEVVALSIDRGGQPAVRSFYDEIDVRALPIYVDATTEALAKLGVIGVPTTLLIDREGREVARYTGPAQWDRPEVIATIERYLPARKP